MKFKYNAQNLLYILIKGIQNEHNAVNLLYYKIIYSVIGWIVAEAMSFSK